MLSLCQAVNATPVLDINLTLGIDPRAINGGSQFYLFEQTYTAGVAGHLTGIEFFYSRPYRDDSPTGQGVTPETMTFLLGAGSGFADEDDLYSWTLALPVSDEVTSFFVDVSAAGVTLDVGMSFIVGWHGTGLYDSYPRIYGSYTPIDQGVRDLNIRTGSMGQSAINPAIRTYVEPITVPTPGPLSLFALLPLAFLARRGRPCG